MANDPAFIKDNPAITMSALRATVDNGMRRLSTSPEKELIVGRPNPGNRELFLQLVEQVLDSQRFTNGGNLVRRLEQELCAYLEVKHCIPVANATVGLQVACKALDLKGEVITTAYTFPATVQALQWIGIKPVYVDIGPEDQLLDTALIEKAITPGTTGILPVHLWGQCCDVERLARIAHQYQLKLVYDAAHAFGNRSQGISIGNFGDCEVFSFHATKIFSTFEGGAIATNDDILAEKIKMLKNHGFNARKEALFSGTNAKMSEIHAAMGLAALPGLPRMVRENRIKFQCYQEMLSDLPALRVLDLAAVENGNCQYLVLEVLSGDQKGIRNALYDALARQGIWPQKYFDPGCHLLGEIRLSTADSCLPVTEKVSGRSLVLPAGNAVTLQDIVYICEQIRAFFQSATIEHASTFL